MSLDSTLSIRKTLHEEGRSKVEAYCLTTASSLGHGTAETASLHVIILAVAEELNNKNPKVYMYADSMGGTVGN